MSIELNQNKEDEKRVKVLKALADPTRLQIIRVLKSRGSEISCAEIYEAFPQVKSTISFHFRTLREADLTIMRKESREKFVVLNQETFDHYFPSFLESLD